MVKTLIVYTSLTGNTKECTEIVQKELTALGVQTELIESTFSDPHDFIEYDICIVGTYTYGIDGTLPDEIVDFYEDLLDVDLTGKVFGTFGSGDTFYEKYCKSVDDFTEQFLTAGATQGAKSVKVDLDPEEEDIKQLKRFAQELLDTWNKKNE